MTTIRILVVSACSKSKASSDQLPLLGGNNQLPARDRYTGRGHQLVRAAIDRWRAERPADRVDWAIVSAGLGLIDELTEIPDYDATFQGMSPAAASARGAELAIPEALEKRLAGYDLALFVLSMSYLHASGAPFEAPRTRLYFASPSFDDSAPGATIVPCGIAEARRAAVAPRVIGATRFGAFVSDVCEQGLTGALERSAVVGVAA